MSTQILRIDQAILTKNFFINEDLTNCNANIIHIKTDFSIEMIKLDDYKEAELWSYQYFISKLIYFTYDKRQDIAFVVEQLNGHNADPKKSYLEIVKKVV